MLRIIEKTKIWFSISLIIILVGVVFMIKDGLNFGIEFKGGAVVEFNLGKTFTRDEVDPMVKKYAPDAVITTVNNTTLHIESRDLSTQGINNLFKDLKAKYNLKTPGPDKQQTVGSSIGSEMTRNAIIAVIIGNILIFFFIRIRFKDYRFGAAAALALIHDVLVTLAFYAMFQIPINSPFIAAILTVIGYSMSDTIVIFDRTRENLRNMRGKDVTEVSNISITQTIARSIFTVLTVLIMIAAVEIFVPSVRDFSKPLLIGITSGAYSSIFIASPFWVMFRKMSEKKKKAALA